MLPSSRPCSAASTASRASPLLETERLSCASQAASMRFAKSFMSDPDAVEELGEVFGFMVDMGGRSNRKFRPLPVPDAAAIQPYGGHAQLMGLHKVSGDIVEHRGCAGRKAAMRQHTAIGGRIGLGRERDGADIPDLREQMGEAQPLQNARCMPGAAIGENIAAARKPLDRESQRRIGMK